MFNLDKTKTAAENLLRLLNASARRPVASGEFTFGAPAAVTPGAGNGNKNTQVTLTYAGANAQVGSTTNVFYNRLNMASFDVGVDGMTVTDSESMSTVLNRIAAATGLLRSEITSASNLPSTGQSGSITVSATPGNLFYTSSFVADLINTSAAPTTPKFYLNSRGMLNGTTSAFKSVRSGLTLTKIGTAGGDEVYSYNNDVAAYVDPASSAVRIPAAEVAGVLLGNWTIEGFVATTTRDATTRALLSQWSTSGIAGQRLLIAANTTNLVVTLGNGTATQTINVAIANFANATWYHLAIVYSGTSLMIFINGALMSTTTMTIAKPTTDHTQDWLIGNQWVDATTSTSVATTGSGVRIDELGVFNFVKYSAAFVVPEFIWTQVARDQQFVIPMEADPPANIMTGQAMTLANGMAISTAQKKRGNSSLYTGATPSAKGYATIDASQVGEIRTGDFSISIDVYTIALAGWCTILGTWSQATRTAANSSWAILFNGTAAQFWFGPHSFAAAAVTGVTMTNNVWHNLKVVRRGTTLSFYQNGVRKGTLTTSAVDTTTMTNTKIVVGQQYSTTDTLPGQDNSPNAYFDNIRIRRGLEVEITTPTTSYESDPNIATVVALLRMNGANNSTDILELRGKTFVAAGNAKITTSQSKFDGSSLILDGSGDFVYTPDKHADFAFGTGDFTKEAWIYVVGYGTNGSILLCMRDNATGILSNVLGISAAGNLQWHNGTAWLATSGTIPLNQWVHVAVSRIGGTLRLFINGVMGYSGAQAVDLSGNRPLYIGSYDDGVTGFELNGLFDEIRINKGYGRYAANFTPQPARFAEV